MCQRWSHQTCEGSLHLLQRRLRPYGFGGTPASHMIEVGLLVFDLALLKVSIVDHLVVMLFAFITPPSEATGTLIGICTLYPGSVVCFILCYHCRQPNLGAAVYLSECGSISTSTLKQKHVSLIACH
jgi:hypothetical protein